jgi:hypothetical protein
MQKLIPFLFFLLLLSCKGTQTEKIARLVTEWQGKEIQFPSNPVFTRYLTDTVDWQIPDSEYKVLIYADQSGCVACKLQLDKWKLLIAEVDSISGKSIPFLFFLDNKDDRDVHFILRHFYFDLPVCIDREGRLNELNRFPRENGFDAFLLDSDNKVVVIGNPVHSLAVKDLYLEQIKGEGNTSPEKEIRTVATVRESEVDMGIFSQTEKRVATFYIQNAEDNPLVIFGTSTTCGCTSVQYDKHPVYKGDSLKVEITMEPKEKGFFSETITVKCNTDKTIALRIKGEVK